MDEVTTQGIQAVVSPLYGDLQQARPNRSILEQPSPANFELRHPTALHAKNGEPR
jgi:hypothetical protein